MTALLYFFLCAAAAAGCDLSNFDHTPPPAIGSMVDNQFARFEWASDADVAGGQTWIWNYIRNLGSVGFGARWDKGRIRVPLLAPLPPGEAACNKYFVRGLSASPDTDAPIFYGTNDQRQDAAAYIEQRTAQTVQGAADTVSVIDTTVQDKDGRNLPVHVDIEMKRTPKGVALSMARTPGLVVGISNLFTGLNSAELANVRLRLGSENVNLQEAPISEYVGGAGNLRGVFDPNELRDREQTRYFFLSGSEKASFEIEGGTFEDKETEMIVLDANRKPLLVAGLNLLLPTTR